MKSFSWPQATQEGPDNDPPVKRSRRRKRDRVQFHRLFKNDHNQSAAEWMVFNMWIDKLAGVEPDVKRWPYRWFNAGPVKKLFKRVEWEG